MMRLKPVLLPALAALVTLLPWTATAAQPVNFNRDVRPILSDNCFACHGFDDKERKARLRLDLREGALAPAKSGAVAVVPGKPDESEFIKRILTDDEDDLMPPPATGKKLTSAQKELLRRWIAEGATYQEHWSFVPPSRPPVPPSASGSANPIDGFLEHRLGQDKLQPQPEADRATLIRRATLDLTGLPPTPE